MNEAWTDIVRLALLLAIPVLARWLGSRRGRRRGR